jgi:RNA polymerase sigma-70 factor (ECF subfamily)
MTVSAFPLFSPSLGLSAHIQAARRRALTSPPAVQALGVATDAELVTQHLAGDPHAFSELVRRYTRAIYNVTYRFTNDTHEAENLSQETFLRAWNALPRIALDKPLKPYLIKIAVNLCRDWAAQKKIATLLPLEDESENDFSDAASDPLTLVSDSEMRERVRARMELLPPLYRTVIALRYTEEMSYEEMATALELPMNTVRTHLHRAKMRLRELMAVDV